MVSEGMIFSRDEPQVIGGDMEVGLVSSKNEPYRWVETRKLGSEGGCYPSGMNHMNRGSQQRWMW